MNQRRLAMDSDLVPEGAVAYREYQAIRTDGSSVTVAFTLGDVGVDSVPAQFARSQRAAAYGLVAVLDALDAPRHPMVWTEHETRIAIAAAHDDVEISDELKSIVVQLIGVFMADIASMAPQLGRRWIFNSPKS